MLEQIKDQYYIYIDVGGDGDFDKGGGQLVSFIFEEHSGGGLPMFEVSFTTNYMAIMTKLNEGSKINVTFGPNSDDNETMVWTIQKYSIMPVNGGVFQVTCKGFIHTNPSDWLTQTVVEWFDDSLNSLDVMQAIAGTGGLSPKNMSPEVPGDNMVRIRHNTPCNKMFQDTWQHSYIADNNFFVYGINHKSEMLIDDYVNLVSKGPKWKLDHTADSDAPVFGNYEHNSNFGLLNNVSAYKKKRQIHQIETGEDLDTTTPDKGVLLADSGSLNITSSEPTHQRRTVSKSENHHDKYWDAYFNNYSKAAVHSSSELIINVGSKYCDFDLFDMVEYTDMPIKNVDEDNGEKTKCNLSGMFIITGISRYVSNKTYGVTLTLTRETLNHQDGALI